MHQIESPSPRGIYWQFVQTIRFSEYPILPRMQLRLVDLRQRKSIESIGCATVRVFYPRSLKFKDDIHPALPVSNPTSRILSFDHWGPLWAVSGSSLGPPNPSFRCYNLCMKPTMAGWHGPIKPWKSTTDHQPGAGKIENHWKSLKPPASWIWTNQRWFSSKAYWISSSSSSFTFDSGSSTKSISAKTAQWSEAISSDFWGFSDDFRMFFGMILGWCWVMFSWFQRIAQRLGLSSSFIIFHQPHSERKP